MAKKSIYKKFEDFKSRYNLSNEDIIQLATEYANSSLELSRTHFTNKYSLTKHVFYKARDYAIICCLIDGSLYEKIREKSTTNFKNNNDKNSAVPSIAHFEDLLVQQTQFLNEFSENEILDIGNKYADGLTVKNIAMAYETGEFAIKKLLRKGIVDLIYDANLVNQIKRIVGISLDPILSNRKANKDALLNCYRHQISFLRLQISHYDLYFRHSVNKPTLESLNNELQNTIKQYNEASKL